LDIGDKFMQADGTLPPQIMPDALHPNAAGYQVWADAMNELLGDMMAGRGAQPVGH
jgi:beta-glucosidase